MPRTFTLNQIKDLIYLHLSRSDFKRRFVQQNTTQKSHQKMLEQIEQYRIQLAEELKAEFDNVSTKFSQYNSSFEEYKKFVESEHQEMQERNSSNTGKCIALKEQCDNLKGFQDLMNSRIEKMSTRMHNFNAATNTRVTELNETLDSKIRFIRETMETESENVATHFEKTKDYCKEIVDLSKAKVTKQVESLNESFKANITTLKTVLETTIQEVATKNKSNIVKIKDVCTKYFEKNDEIMRNVQDKAKVVNEAYEEFFTNVIKPQQVGEARIYAIETRLKEEEDYRILENSHLKDVMKKLIFAIEQANLVSKDLNSNENYELSQHLPNLLNRTAEHSSTNRRNSEHREAKINYSTLQNKGIDILYLKRLMYLRNLVDDNRHIEKERRELSKERLENNNNQIEYSNTLNSAILSLKPAEQKDSLLAENTIFSQANDLNKINSSNSPTRITLGEKIGNRRDKFRQTHNKIFNQIQRNSNKISNANNTFFVTQSSKDRKSRIKLNKTNLDEGLYASHRKLDKNLTDGSIPSINPESAQDPDTISKITESKFMTEKDKNDILEIEKNKREKAQGRNEVEGYWKLNPSFTNGKGASIYKSFDNIKADKTKVISQIPSSQQQ